jgi:hypothetical protein
VGVPVAIGDSLKLGELYSLTIGKQRLQATLKNLRGDVDALTLTVGAIFLLPDNARAKTGETIHLELAESIYASGGWIPLSALTAGNRGLWNVLAVKTTSQGEVAARESVEIIYSENDQVFVAGTLAADARIIASGLHRLSPGALIAPLED